MQPEDLTDTQVNALVDFERLPTFNAETLASGRTNELDTETRRAMRYIDCNGTTVKRTFEEAIAHIERLRSERAERDARRQRHIDFVRHQLEEFRKAEGLCMRDTQCLRQDGHADECAFDRGHLAMLGEKP